MSIVIIYLFVKAVLKHVFFHFYSSILMLCMCMVFFLFTPFSPPTAHLFLISAKHGWRKKGKKEKITCKCKAWQLTKKKKIFYHFFNQQIEWQLTYLICLIIRYSFSTGTFCPLKFYVTHKSCGGWLLCAKMRKIKRTSERNNS